VLGRQLMLNLVGASWGVLRHIYLMDCRALRFLKMFLGHCSGIIRAVGRKN
jgi:hypothetical protein